MKPVLRFAPSPTGYLHIGGARTALFNWLYARGRGGKFLLRIEDTDRERHNEAAVAAILDGLSWLGLDWDGDPISQFSRRERHVEIATGLLDEGRAYKCYLSPEEIDVARTKARDEGARFISPWRDRDDHPEGRGYTIRFRAPETGETVVRDAVQGDVAFPNAALDDLIILRSPGADTPPAPTYNLAVVVDDHDMGVTHVIRGDDHLANAARQQQIYEALGWPVPVFAHVPLIHGSDGAKLSKRHGALGVEAYRDDGYLAEALASYLIKLGWSHGDEEIIPRARALEVFDLAGINKAPARLDIDKLNHINGVYLSNLDNAAFLAAAAPFLEAAHGALSDGQHAALTRGAGAVKNRMTTLKDAGDAAGFIVAARPFALSGKAGKPLKKDGAVAMLSEIRDRLARDGGDWRDPDALEALLQGLAAEKDVGFGQIGPPLRAALTGGAPAPSLGEVLYILGEDESLSRIDDQLTTK